KTLQNYTAFLEQIIEAYGSLFRQIFAKKKITINDLFGMVLVSNESLPMTVKEWQSKRIKLIPLSRGWVNAYMQGIFPKNMYS
ncbi:hypothetical protein WAJ58_25360, partial [Acinetobacter baumannii]